MKLSTPISTLAFAAVAMAQATRIVSPLDGTNVTRGSELVVQLERGRTMMGSIEVGIVIGLQSCPVTDPYPCTPPQSEVGSVLFNGQYNPVAPEPWDQPYENFTVTIPTADYFSGRAQLSVDRFHLIGAGPAAILEFNNITLNIVG